MERACRSPFPHTWPLSPWKVKHLLGNTPQTTLSTGSSSLGKVRICMAASLCSGLSGSYGTKFGKRATWKSVKHGFTP